MFKTRQTWVSDPVCAALHGEFCVPGDKSISHRAIMLAALADGISHISGLLESEDTLATMHAFHHMGVHSDRLDLGKWQVRGVGLHGLSAPSAPIDCGNSGTTMRLLAGILAGQSFDTKLVGDVSLTRRPMSRIIEPLRRMGAQIEAESDNLPPLRIRGGRALHGIDYTPPVASAQVKSALLLAGLYADGETRVVESIPTRDYTERLLTVFGWPATYHSGYAIVSGHHRLRAADLIVPGDFSSAAFFIVAATLVPGSKVILRNIGINPRRTGLLTVLRLMGANIREMNVRQLAGECIADLCISHAVLAGIDVPQALVADMIDEFPIFFVAAAAARGTTRIRGAGELRVKESDRIAVMAWALRKLGIHTEETRDGAIIEGGQLCGGEVDSTGDHRCAMSLAVAGLVADGPVRISDCKNVVTSFPEFIETANRCGFAIQSVE